METLDTLTASIPYALLAAVPTGAVVFLLFKRRRHNPRTRSCPHCRATIETDENVCSSCHRKVAYV